MCVISTTVALYHVCTNTHLRTVRSDLVLIDFCGSSSFYTHSSVTYILIDVNAVISPLQLNMIRFFGFRDLLPPSCP